MTIIRNLVKRSMKPSINLMHSFPTEREDDFEQLLHFVDEFVPSDFNCVQYFPFRLTLVQPGEIDMNFVQRFGLKLEPGYGFDVRHARIAFGREPKWSTEYVNDAVTIERQYKLREYLTKWQASDSSQCQQASSYETISLGTFAAVKRQIKRIPGAVPVIKTVKNVLNSP